MLKGHVLHCYGEPGGKPNQRKKEVNNVKCAFSIDYGASHLLELLFRLEGVELNEPSDLDDGAPEEKIEIWDV